MCIIYRAGTLRSFSTNCRCTSPLTRKSDAVIRVPPEELSRLGLILIEIWGAPVVNQTETSHSVCPTDLTADSSNDRQLSRRIFCQGESVLAQHICSVSPASTQSRCLILNTVPRLGAALDQTSISCFHSSSIQVYAAVLYQS